ncbi:hypothetical protein PGT21_000954 [Puccinia graminis f. sp. tritici]|uniref:Endonuclease/exonuclease/phosphatase domain-containing protein n=1 Tax=Puccinia graminis f. sp. tritici TaxID=56615 RepID=A0A5B0LII2_PUCGR|nr:hypothetical protein PGT21_000954 [Puccinia graminis f. sp. tritici]
MDSNLHHRSWNPPNYNHSHQQSKDLIRTCGRHGFKIVSEKDKPTFMNRRTSSTVIDLVWGNFSCFQLIDSFCTSSNNFGSDHQAIVLNLNFNPHPIPVTRLSVDLNSDVDKFVDELTISFQNSINRQKKTVNSNSSKFKAWWDKDILSPIIQNRNRAQKWMLIARSVQASDCYHFWQKKFKEKVFDLKRNHWQKFLAESKDHHIFKAYKFTKPVSSGNIAPLLNENDELTSDKGEQACLLFKGTSEVPINCDLEDIVPPIFPIPFSFPDISIPKIDNIISNLPKKKASANDKHPVKQLINHEINNSPRSHLSPIHNLLDNHLLSDYDLQALEIIKFHVIPPWSSFSLDVLNLNIQREKAKSVVTNQISDKKETLLFSDGSNIPDLGSASAALLNNSISFACRINDTDKALAFEAEVQAINIGLDIIKNEIQRNSYLPPTLSASFPTIRPPFRLSLNRLDQHPIKQLSSKFSTS